MPDLTRERVPDGTHLVRMPAVSGDQREHVRGMAGCHSGIVGPPACGSPGQTTASLYSPGGHPSDNPVGRVPDTRSTRRGLLRLTPDGWSLGRHRGRWTGAGPDRLLDRLDVLHSVHCTGTPLPGDSLLCARTMHRAVARGSYVSGVLSADVDRHVSP